MNRAVPGNVGFGVDFFLTSHADTAASFCFDKLF